MFDENIDLRKSIQSLLGAWRFILLMSLAASLIAYLASSVLPPRYESTATLLLTRSRVSLALATQFPTVTEPIDNRSRMNAILAIAMSDSIAHDVFETLSVNDNIRFEDVREVKDKVSINDVGDAIQFTVSEEDPEVAALLANTWAARAVQAINASYSGKQPLTEIQIQLAEARTDYEDAQSRLEEFIENNEIGVLEVKIIEAETLVQVLSDYRAWQISYQDERKREMEILIDQVEALIQQLDEGTVSAAGNLGDALAVMIARANALGVPSKNVVDIQFMTMEGITEPDPNYVEDLIAISEQANFEKEQAEAILSALADDFSAGEFDRQLVAIDEQIRTLKTRLEEENVRHRQLQSNRDFAWNAFEALAQKEIEIRNAAESENLVTVASPAVPADKPESRRLVNTLVAGFAGFVAGIAWIILTIWWRASTSESSGARER